MDKYIGLFGKYRNKNGHIVIPCTFIQNVEKIGGLGICDDCNKVKDNGNIIPVLGRWYCDECTKEWEKRAKYYEEDKDIEERKAIDYLYRIQ